MNEDVHTQLRCSVLELLLHRRVGRVIRAVRLRDQSLAKSMKEW